MRIAIAGASGFIGRRVSLDVANHTDHVVVSLSRSGSGPTHPHIEGRTADFFSLYSAEMALAGCDVGVYLLHSMTPSHRLTQGRFEDFDFILADNFARAARSCGLKRIVYVGGMIDEQCTRLSRHLASRQEVEAVLGSYGVPVTSIRCSLVIGAEGSSFAILNQLVRRLPILLLPAWSSSLCQPVAIDDLVLIVRRSLDHAPAGTTSIDVGAPETMTYRELVEQAAALAHGKRWILDVPMIPMGLAKLWIKLITGAPRDLVYPLVDSLVHSMTVRPGHRAGPDLIECYTPIARALELEMTRAKQALPKTKTKRSKAKLVQSVQRLSLPPHMDAYQVANFYFRWLSLFFTRILTVKNRDHLSAFCLFGVRPSLLELTFAPARSGRDRQLFYITGGLLAKQNPRARLEFRESPDKRYVFAAIHDYEPALPWWIYRLSQALFHRYVMWRFGLFLKRMGARSDDRQQSKAFTSPTAGRP
jgi:uncharacterized protein YbjT (DUF2867 family)